MKTELIKRKSCRPGQRLESGFTLIEVMVASSIMVILSIGVLSVFSFAVRINAGNNLREQALTVLQKEVEYYRSLKYVPNEAQSDPALVAGSYTRPDRTSEDGTVFHISVDIDNNLATAAPDGIPEANYTLKQITIHATPANPRHGWLADLHTDITFQRVRSN
jgi:prepilin-type N-terminal cleavage/methylation domain-containing protein